MHLQFETISMAAAVLVAVIGACAPQAPAEGGDGGTWLSDASETKEDGGRDASYRQDAGEGLDASLDAGDASSLEVRPTCYLPNIEGSGWRRVESGCCDLRTPEKLGDIPPIEWESCAYDGGVDCQIMKVTWTDGIARFNLTRMTTDDDGNALLAFHRYPVGADGRLWVLAEADGEVLNAILEPKARTGCLVSRHDLNDGRYLLDLFGNARLGAVDMHSAHIVGGEIGGEPRHLWHELDAPVYLGAWTTFSRELMVHWFLGRVEVTDWQLQGRQIIYSSAIDPDGLTPWESTVIDTSVFVVARWGGNSGVISWTPENGVRNLLRWPGDQSRGASNFGTDGEVMIWTYGEGKPPDGGYGDFATYSIMTAPVTTDPAQLQATSRRLRSDFGGALVGRNASWKVGCGYAARADRGADGLGIVRLEDGAAWFLPSTSGFRWFQTAGVTCTEVFASASTPRGDLVARVRIDSLGLPLPPD